jgi:hypothetical protein
MCNLIDNFSYAGVTATFALGLTVVNIILTLRQNSFNNKKLIDRERPEIIPDSISLPDFNLEGRPIATIRFANAGASPAFNVKIERTFRIDYSGTVPVHPPDILQDSSDSFRLSPYPVPSKGGINVDINGPPQIANKHFWEVVLNNEMGHFTLFVYGTVTYTGRDGTPFPPLKFNYVYFPEPKIFRTIPEFNKFIGEPYHGAWTSYPVYNQ